MALDYKGKYEFLQRVDENVDVNVGPTTSLATIAFQDSHGFRVVSVHNVLQVGGTHCKTYFEIILPFSFMYAHLELGQSIDK